MLLVKVLERKSVIRFFGLAMLIAPVMNIMLSMSLQLVSDRWTLFQFSKVLSAQGIPNNILNVASVIIGIAMLSGSRRSWKFVMTLLGAHIALQVPALGTDLRKSWIYGVFFLVNLGTFLFIADQLAFKQNKKKADLPTKPSPPQAVVKPLEIAKPKPIWRTSSKRILVSFQGALPWAQLVNVNAHGVELKGLGQSPPPDLAIRGVTLKLGSELILRLKFSRQLDNKFFFEYTEMDSVKIQRMNLWLSQVQTRKAA